MFPLLLDNENSEILITLDQSALIAGLLMYGNCVGVLFSSVTFHSSKYPVCFCLSIQVIGWMLMRFAEDANGIMASRFFVGLANGFGTNQLKWYIQETCGEELAKFLCKYLSCLVFLGVVLANIAGPFLSFRSMSWFCLVFPSVGLVVFLLTPKYIKIEGCVARISTVDVEVNLEAPQRSVFEIFTDTAIRNNVIFMVFILVLSLYTGAASNIVYSKIIYTTAGAKYPEVLAIFYGISVLFGTALAIQRIHQHTIKTYLSYSFPLVALTSLMQSLFFIFPMDRYFEHMEFPALDLLLLMVSTIYALAHAFGFTTVPLLILNQKIPDFAKETVYKIFVIVFSISAITSTKLFQVIFTYMDMGLAYMILALIAFSGFVFVFVFDKFLGAIIQTSKCYQISKLKVTHF